MNSLGRRLFATAAVLSLLLFFAAIGAVALALSACDVWTYQMTWPANGGQGNIQDKWTAEFAGGGVLLKHQSQTLNLPYPQARQPDDGQLRHVSIPAGPMEVQQWPMNGLPPQLQLMGNLGKQAGASIKGFGRGNFGLFFWHTVLPVLPGFSSDGFVVAVPIWLVGGVSALIVAAWEMRHFLHRRFRSKPAGMCSKCGYDLCATPNRCPECGTIPQNAKPAPANLH